MTTLDMLDRVLILLERGWCKGSFARDADGESTDPLDPKAVKWCLWGACIAAAGGTQRQHEVMEAIQSAFLTLHPDVEPHPQDAIYASDLLHRMADWNDMPHRTVEEVVELVLKTRRTLRFYGLSVT